MAPVNDPTVGGFVDCVRLAWSVHLMLIQEGAAARDTISTAPSKDLQNFSSCLAVIFTNNVFQFFLDNVLRTAAYQVLFKLFVCKVGANLQRQPVFSICSLQEVIVCFCAQNDDEDMTYMYNAYLHKLITIFLSEPLARDKVSSTHLLTL